MSARTDLASQWGLIKEDSWGVYKAPTRFLPFAGEGFGGGPDIIQGEGIVAGRLGDHEEHWALGNQSYKGDISGEFFTTSSPILLEAFLGRVQTTGPAGGLYTHTFDPFEPMPSYTLQIGIVDPGTGTVYPKTYTGGKVDSWEMAFEVGKMVTFGSSWTFKDEILYRQVTDGVTTNGSAVVTSATAVFVADDVGKPISGSGIPANTTILSRQSATQVTMSANATATASSVTVTIGVALAAASYAANVVPWTFEHAVLQVYGQAPGIVPSLKLRGINSLSYDERRGLGSTKIAGEQVSQKKRKWEGDMLAEFAGNFTQYRRYKNGTLGTLSLVCTSGTHTLTFTEQIRLMGETPKAGKNGIIQQPLKFDTVGGTDAEQITVVAVNPDSAP